MRRAAPLRWGLALCIGACVPAGGQDETLPSPERRPAEALPAESRPAGLPSTVEAFRAAEPPSMRRLRARADTVRDRVLTAGVRHTYLWLAEGPHAVHIIEAAHGACPVPIQVRHAGPPLYRRALTSHIGRTAVAAINADFFLIPRGEPVGAQVSDGMVQSGPGQRPVFGIPADSAYSAMIGEPTLQGVLAAGADSFPLEAVNRWSPDEATEGGGGGAGGEHAPPDRRAAVAFTHWHGERSPAHDSTRLSVAVFAGEAAGAWGRGVVVRVDSLSGALAIDSMTTVFVLPRRSPRPRAAWPAAGDTVHWRIQLEIRTARGTSVASEAVGGFPVLLSGGKAPENLPEAASPAFVMARHPRSAIAIDHTRRRLFLVVIDGRQESYSAGMSLPELAGLMAAIGAEDALNLDGGGSTALALRGRIVNRPSDRTGERPVGNAVLLFPPSCD